MSHIQRGGKREAIIEAAIQVFSDKGYHNARMEEIAIVAGIGKGTIYEYFDSKLHLFQAVMENSVKFYFDSLASAEDPVSISDRIRHLLESHIRFCQVNRELTKIVFWDTDIVEADLKEWALATRKEREEHMTQLIRQSIDRGELRDLNAQLLTLMIGGLIGSMWSSITLDDWNIDASEIAGVMTDMIMNGIAPRN